MKKITLGLFLFVTTIVSAQFSENFDTGTFPPAGWASFIGVNGAGTTSNWTTAGTSPARNAFVDFENSGSVNEDWLVTPLISISATQNTLEFLQTDRFNIDYGSTYTIRVSTASQTTHSDFVIIDTQTETDVRNGVAGLTSRIVDLSIYNGQDIYIAFVLEQDDGDGWFLDDVEVDAVQTCVDPSNFVINTPTTSTTFDVSWDPSSLSGTYEVEYEIAGFTQGTGILSTEITPDFFVSTLTPDTDYDFYFRANCGMGDFSDWVGPLGLRTLRDCAVEGALPWSEDFSGAGAADCIVLEDVGTISPAWQFNGVNDFDGDGNDDQLMAIPSSDTEGTKDDYLFGPAISLTAGVQYTFSFRYNSLLNTATPTTLENNTVRFLVADATVSTANITVLGENLTVTQQGTPGDMTGNDVLSQAYTSSFTYTPNANETIYPTVHVNTPANGESMWFLLTEMSVTTTASNSGVSDNSVFFTVSPNPASTVLNLESTVVITKIEIVNMLGQNILNINNDSNGSIDVSNLDNGMYFITAHNQNGKQTIKFLKE